VVLVDSGGAIKFFVIDSGAMKVLGVVCSVAKTFLILYSPFAAKTGSFTINLKLFDSPPADGCIVYYKYAFIL
jgi:hypothetical protein